MTKHEPSGYGYLISSRYEQFNKGVQIYRGENASEHFIDALDRDFVFYQKKLKMIKPMELSREDETKFQEAENCFICTMSFDGDHDLGNKVRDHDHVTGKFRGAAHSFCNLQMRQLSDRMYIYMHNAKG